MDSKLRGFAFCFAPAFSVNDNMMLRVLRVHVLALRQGSLSEAFIVALGWSGAPVSELGSRKTRLASDLVSDTIRETLLKKENMATGPLRQATGPPWSGAEVGVGMLRGAGDSLT